MRTSKKRAVVTPAQIEASAKKDLAAIRTARKHGKLIPLERKQEASLYGCNKGTVLKDEGKATVKWKAAAVEGWKPTSKRGKRMAALLAKGRAERYPLLNAKAFEKELAARRGRFV